MIDLIGLTKTYAGPGGPVTALDGVDLHVGRGEIFGVIGRSGAGKSTLVRTLNLLERPTAGRVIVDGRDLTELDRAGLNAARRSIGMVFQHFALLARRTVAQNVAFPLELAGTPSSQTRRRVDELLDVVGLADKRDQYPAKLSGGQKQRVGIARALASRPRILLCDEATSALDPETTAQILDLIRSLRDRLDLTVVLITHEMGVIKAVADRVAVIERGRIIESGRVFDVFTRPSTETTRRFVAEVIGHDLPAAVRDRLPPETRLVRVLFRGPHADRPVIAEVARRFAVDLAVVHGRVDEIHGEPFGTLTFAVHGAPDSAAAALAWLRTLDLDVEEIAHDRGDVRSAA